MKPNGENNLPLAVPSGPLYTSRGAGGGPAASLRSDAGTFPIYFPIYRYIGVQDLTGTLPIDYYAHMIAFGIKQYLGIKQHVGKHNLKKEQPSSGKMGRNREYLRGNERIKGNRA